MTNARATYDELGGDCRIGEGGLLRRFELATRLTQLHRQLAVLLGLTWVPVVLLGFYSGDPGSLVYGSAVHVRLLLVTPLLLVIDHVFPGVCRYTLGQVLRQGHVPQRSRPRFWRMFLGARAASDSLLPEAILAALALGLGAAALQGAVHVRGVSSADAGPDRFWYVLVCMPLFQFLLWRSVWRWAIWVWILLGLSRMQLDLVPTHPDHCGGIRILSLPSIGYCSLLLFALSSVLSAEWEERATLGANLESLGPLLILLAVGGTLIAFGPLLPFAPQLYLAKRRGSAELGGVATSIGRQFRTQLIERQKPLERECVIAMASAEQAYRETVNRLTLLLFDKKDLALLLVATLLPCLPTLLTYVSKEDWLALGSLLVGWKP